jgi:hypothetical protein
MISTRPMVIFFSIVWKSLVYLQSASIEAPL